jgi:hypothetical protein
MYPCVVELIERAIGRINREDSVGKREASVGDRDGKGRERTKEEGGDKVGGGGDSFRGREGFREENYSIQGFPPSFVQLQDGIKYGRRGGEGKWEEENRRE